jgi:hypothetical protein
MLYEISLLLIVQRKRIITIDAVVTLADELLLDFLRCLVARGLGSSERINAAITTLQSWFNQVGIPYRLSRFAW